MDEIRNYIKNELKKQGLIQLLELINDQINVSVWCQISYQASIEINHRINTEILCQEYMLWKEDR